MRKVFDIRLLFCIGIIQLLGVSIFAQAQPEILATAKGHSIAISDLSPATRNLIESSPETIAKIRSGLLDQMIGEELLAAEAKARGTDPAKLAIDISSKAPSPTETEISAVYQSNLAALQNKPLKDVREQIVSYLKNEAGQQEFSKFIDSLRAKYKIVNSKNVNAPKLLPTDILVTVNGKPITARDFEQKNKFDLFEVRAQISDQVLGELYSQLYSALVLDEAAAQGVDAGTIIAREVSNKMHDYTDSERAELEGAFQERLFTKYNVKVLYEEPQPIARDISVGTSPSTGPATAPVTIVMFSDFQCPACSAAHPILKKVMAEYAGKIRFVVRNYPLTNRHDHAMRAALAAAAARAQGKFFEYIDVLYTHQDALDDASLRRYASEQGLNMKQFELDFNSEKTAADIRRDVADGDSYKLGGTPSIFVNGVLARDLSASGLRRTIDRAIKK